MNMTKLILIISLLINNCAHAVTWKKAGNKNNTDIYVDMDSVKYRENYLYYWSLANIDRPTEEGYRSSMMKIKADCKTKKIMLLTQIFFKQPMGEGEKAASESYQKEWMEVNKNFPAYKISKVLCNQRDGLNFFK